jgi:cell division protein FtsB
MHDFQKKKRIKKIIYSPVVIAILVLFLIILIRGVWGVYKKAYISTGNLEREKLELEKLSFRQKNLASSIDYLKTDQGIENEIRTKFRAVKEGEKVVIIVDDQTISTTSSEITTSTHGIWYKVFHWPQ